MDREISSVHWRRMDF